MLITYFKDYRTLARYRSGLANIYVQDFIGARNLSRLGVIAERSPSCRFQATQKSELL
jgi:hypothetical protein